MSKYTLWFFAAMFVAGDVGDLGVARQEVQRTAFPRSRLVAVPGAAHNDLTGARAGDVIPVLTDYFLALGAQYAGATPGTCPPQP